MTIERMQDQASVSFARSNRAARSHRACWQRGSSLRKASERRLSWLVVVGILAPGCGRIGFSPLVCEDQLDCATDASPDAASLTGSDGGEIPIDAGGEFALNIVAMDCGSQHCCALTDEPLLRCWGSNAEGQLNNVPSKNEASIISYSPVAVSQPTHLTSHGTTNCVWGAEPGREFVGRRAAGFPHSDTDAAYEFCESGGAPLEDAFHCSVSAGSAGHLCEGNNDSGQVDFPPSASGAGFTWTGPKGVVLELALGRSHTCAEFLVEGSRSVLICQGANQFNQLGGTGQGGASHETDLSTRPAIVSLSNIAAGDFHFCGLNPSGAVYCWGANDSEQSSMAVGGITDEPTLYDGLPAGVRGVDLALGASHSSLLGTDANVYCWGSNAQQQLGGAKEPGATRVAGVSGATMIAAGGDHSCALVPTEGIYCWGSNTDYQVSADVTAAAAPSLRLR